MQSPLQCHKQMAFSRPSSKTIILTQSSVSQKTCTMNVHSRVFPTVTDEWPFQNLLPSKTIILTGLDRSPRRPEQWTCSLPQNHRWTTISRPFYNSIDLNSSVSADLNSNWAKSIHPVLTPNGHSLCHCTHIWHISLNKYDCHMGNVCNRAKMLNGHIDLTFCTYVPNYNQLQCKVHMLLPNMC